MIKQHGPVTLFLSYTHKDEPSRQELEVHLGGLKREGLISIWHDRQIVPGTDWAHEIDAHLNEASIILLLVSSDFINSDYCYNIEMQHALERHRRGETRVIPVILRPCDWQHSPLKDLQCLPRDGKAVKLWPNPDEAFYIITQELRRVIEEQAPVPLVPQDRKHRLHLLKRVRQWWIEGVLEHTLQQTPLITPDLQEQLDALANPWNQDVQETSRPSRLLPPRTSIIQVYDKAEGELLILGKPGAGKTTLLLEITRTLLERVEENEHLPMPVVFNLSSWAKKQEPLATWLIEELQMKYYMPRKIAEGWIGTNQVLPLLDGLDEVATKKARVACVEKINDYYLERGGSPIVVCCRSQEYIMLSESSKHSTRTMLKLPHAVGILDLTDKQISTHLEQVGEQARGLREALDKDAELHSLALQPFMLQIMTLGSHSQ